MEEKHNNQEPSTKKSSVSSEVEFEVKLGDTVHRSSVEVHIDSEDSVTLTIPDDFRLEGEDVTTVTIRTSAKVKVLPDILSTRFGSDNKLFYSTCSVFVNLDFSKTGDEMKCSHCSYTVNVKEARSKEELTEMLLQHLPQHQDYLPCLRFSCKKCKPVSIVSLDVLLKHFEKIHPATLNLNSTDSEGPKTLEKTEYICPICSMICFNNKALMNHMNEYHSSESNKTSHILPNADDMQNGIEVSTNQNYSSILLNSACVVVY